MSTSKIKAAMAFALATSLGACAGGMSGVLSPGARSKHSERGEKSWHLLPTSSATWATEPLPSPPVDMMGATGAILADGRFASWRYAYDGVGGAPGRMVNLQLADGPSDFGVSWVPSGKWGDQETRREFCQLVDSATIYDSRFPYAMIGICSRADQPGKSVVLFDRRTASVEESQVVGGVSHSTELITTFLQLHGGIEVITMELDASGSPLAQHRFWLRSGRPNAKN